MTTWRADGDVVLPGAVHYTLSTGDAPTDQWHVSVSMPSPMFRDIAGPGPWPTLYVLDAPLTFLITAQIAQNAMGLAAGQMRPVVIVGIVRAPASNDFQAFDEHRNHDLTPTTFVPPLLEGSVPHGTGGADTTLDLITKEIAPYLEDRHALDPADRGIAGLSLSGLTTCWALLTRPNEFRRYLAVSPAIHWDYHLLLDETRLPAVPAPQAQVYLAVGENEEDHVREWPVAPPEAVELADSDMKMVSDTLSLADRLRRAGTDVRTEVIADENHQTVWPAAVTRGLIHLYQAHRFSGAGH